ncbi:MAG: hypothetical protein GYA24_04935 [Candidatus Lokiarchaeota archaeon]|nr:hypothetical protein [Candidatus Lokiarchaeota archaeon]
MPRPSMIAVRQEARSSLRAFDGPLRWDGFNLLKTMCIVRSIEARPRPATGKHALGWGALLEMIVMCIASRLDRDPTR